MTQQALVFVCAVDSTQLQFKVNIGLSHSAGDRNKEPFHMAKLLHGRRLHLPKNNVTKGKRFVLDARFDVSTAVKIQVHVR
jgi:hypothetical protein